MPYTASCLMMSRQSKPWAMKRFEPAWKPPLRTWGQWRTNSCQPSSFLSIKSREYSSLTEKIMYMYIYLQRLCFCVSRTVSKALNMSTCLDLSIETQACCIWSAWKCRCYRCTLSDCDWLHSSAATECVSLPKCWRIHLMKSSPMPQRMSFWRFVFSQSSPKSPLTIHS